MTQGLRQGYHDLIFAEALQVNQEPFSEEEGAGDDQGKGTSAEGQPGKSGMSSSSVSFCLIRPSF